MNLKKIAQLSIHKHGNRWILSREWKHIPCVKTRTNYNKKIVSYSENYCKKQI